jgi:hypothetical protein
MRRLAYLRWTTPHLLAGFYEELLQHDFLDAFAGGQPQRLRTYERRIRRFARHVRSRAAKLDLHVCAKY